MKKATKYLILALVLMSASCKKEKPEETPPPGTTPTGGFFMHLHTYIDNTEIYGYNIVYTSDDGRKVLLTTAQAYISHIRLVKPDNSEIEISGKRILKTLENDVYYLGEVPVGNYKTVKFSVGFDAADNALDPLTPSDSAILNKPQMWMSATAQPDGYVFVNLEGKVDTTAAANGSVGQMQNFSYHVGTSAHYTQVTMPDQNFTITEGSAYYSHIIVDYYKIYNGLQLNNASNLNMTSVSDNATTLGNYIGNRIPLMFRYE